MPLIFVPNRSASVRGVHRHQAIVILACHVSREMNSTKVQNPRRNSYAGTGCRHYPSPRQVHGLLHALSRRRGPEGCQCSHCYHQDQTHHPVCRLVPHWLQGRHQLPATHCRPRRRSGQGAACSVHVVQHHSHRRSLGPCLTLNSNRASAKDTQCILRMRVRVPRLYLACFTPVAPVDSL